jgi:BASS family bile acid:Na+ symporter
MAILVAWWGIWHIIAGLAAAFIFSRQPLPADFQPESGKISF